MKVAPVTKLCAEHGEYESEQLRFANIVWLSGCPRCDVLKAEREEAEAAEKKRVEAERRKERAFARAVDESGIEVRFITGGLASWEAETPAEKKALGFAQDFVGQFAEIRSGGRCAAFVGNPGTGKTHLASAIGIELLRGGHSVAYATVQRIIRRVKATWERGTREETEVAAISAYTDPDLLILDEVGVQFGSEFEKQLMFEIVDTRYARILPTLLISNLPARELKKYLGERVIDRLNHNGLGVIAFDWGSRRK